MSNGTRKIVVVGGGIAGLAAAHRVQELAKESNSSAEITLVEGASRLGGVIETTTRDGFLLEAGPDCFLSEKPAGLTLAKELGLENEIISTNSEHRRSFILRGSRLCEVPEGFYLMAPVSLWRFAMADFLSWPGKMRAAFDFVLPRRAGTGDESLGSFVRRRFGQEVLDRAAQPMIAGIYAADPDKLSLKATMPKFLELEEKYGSVIRGLRAARKGRSEQTASGPRYSLFLSFREGMETFVRSVQKRLNVETRINSTLQSLHPTPDGRWHMETTGGALDADAVILALTGTKTVPLLKPFADSLAQELSEIPYGALATINFAYRREQIGHSLDGMGFVVPDVEKRDLLACSFSSQKFAGRAPKDLVLLRAFVGGANDLPILQRDDNDLIAAIESDLREILRIEGSPIFTSLNRYQQSLPHYAPGHLDRVERMERELEKYPGLYLAGNAYRGVGVPDVIGYARSTAEHVHQYLTATLDQRAKKSGTTG